MKKKYNKKNFFFCFSGRSGAVGPVGPPGPQGPRGQCYVKLILRKKFRIKLKNLLYYTFSPKETRLKRGYAYCNTFSFFSSLLSEVVILNGSECEGYFISHHKFSHLPQLDFNFMGKLKELHLNFNLSKNIVIEIKT